MNKRDLQALRRVIRHVSTSDTTIQAEVLRLDAVLDKAIKETTTKEKKHGPQR